MSGFHTPFSISYTRPTRSAGDDLPISSLSRRIVLTAIKFTRRRSRHVRYDSLATSLSSLRLLAPNCPLGRAGTIVPLHGRDAFLPGIASARARDTPISCRNDTLASARAAASPLQTGIWLGQQSCALSFLRTLRVLSQVRQPRRRIAGRVSGARHRMDIERASTRIGRTGWRLAAMPR